MSISSILHILYIAIALRKQSFIGKLVLIFAYNYCMYICTHIVHFFPRFLYTVLKSMQILLLNLIIKAWHIF